MILIQNRVEIRSDQGRNDTQVTLRRMYTILVDSLLKESEVL